MDTSPGEAEKQKNEDSFNVSLCLLVCEYGKVVVCAMIKKGKIYALRLTKFLVQMFERGL